MPLQFTRSQLTAFLCIMLTVDLVLVTTIASTKVPPATGVLIVVIGIAAPLLIFTVFVPVLAGAMGWFTLRRLYPAVEDQTFRADAPMISPRFGSSWMGLNNVVEAYADQDYLHMRLFAPIPRSRMPVSIPWAAVHEIEPFRKHWAILHLDSASKLYIPHQLAAKELDLRASLEQESPA